MDLESRIRNVTAVLGPTNTGKTHLAIERMLGHESGLIGLPLRLLAREVYDKIAARVGTEAVALITGEEKIKPERARYSVCTVEAMPRDIDVDFLAIDEVQLAADPERGHVFTDRLLHARGRRETLLLGAGTIRDCIADLIPGANFISRPRLSKLTYSGEKKITRLPARTAIVAFSANEVYEIAELIRRQRGGAAVVLGALSPRTRNAQVALYQGGDVQYLVATDAIGMGLNLDVDHVAFAGTRKFDGQVHRELTPAETGQIAGRAGRHMNDGTFGVTGDVRPFDNDLIERLENHQFEPVKLLQWRNRKLDFGSVERLRESLRELPRESRLTRARVADDVIALEALSGEGAVLDRARTPDRVELLWDVCQVPDYRKISTQNHAELVTSLFMQLSTGEGRIAEDWFARQVDLANRTDGDIDTLATRLAHIRTWTFVSNRASWLKDPAHWQGKTREIEDALSDALHEQLTQRFVDRRTSALMRGMRDKDELAVEIGDDGAIRVEDHYVGRLKGFRFQPDAQAEGIHGKATRGAAGQVLAKELAMRARRVAAAKPDAFKLTRSGKVRWRDEEIAELQPSDDPLKPTITLLADEYISGPDKEKVQARLNQWVGEIVADKLGPLVELAKSEDIAGLARGIAFRLNENFGILKREEVGDEIRSLDQTARAQLRKYGVRFGAFNIYVPILLKPAASELRLALWALKGAAATGLAIDALPEPPRAGLTSLVPDKAVPEAFYRVLGYHPCGPRAVRIDMLERLADAIRPLLAFKSGTSGNTPPKGSTGDGGFTAIPEMMSILGCSAAELGEVLRALGFRSEKRVVKLEAPVEVAAGAAPPARLMTAGDTPVAVVAAPPVAAPAAPPVASDATEADEERFIEVWRPRRHRPERREHGREAHRGGQGQRREGGRGREGGRPGRPGPRPAAQPGAAPSADAAVIAAPPATETAAATPSPAPQARHDRSDRGDELRDRRDRREEGPPRDSRRRDEPRHRERDRDDRRGPRHDRSGGRGRDERAQPQVRTAAPPKRSGVDPDSPFAKLSALKEQLEKRAQD